MNRFPAPVIAPAPRRRFRRTGRFSALAVSIAAGVGLVAAPIVSTLTASPAAATTAISAVGSLVSSGAGITTLAVTPVNVGDVLVATAEPGGDRPRLWPRSRAAG